MNPRPANTLDRDAIAEQLAELDSSDPGDPSKSPEAPSTVRELKAQLDTLIGQLREPVGPDPFAEETGLRRAQELVRAIGVENVSQAKGERPELGRIGPYELLEKLGEGGMGAVYKALHSSLEKIVALKVLPRNRLHPDAIARFKREMKAVGKLDHPNIVRATDAGEMGGEHFLVMEYVDGVDLSELLRRVGPLDAADVCELVRQAAIGLQHAHQRGMVHRDIKPNNLMLAWGDEHAPAVKILDMGLALLSEPAAGEHGDLTSAGQMMGTIEYMSPEQGLDTHNVDIRSDIYSLGATLYKLLCGKAPFSGERYNTPGKMMVALATEQPASIGAKRDGLPAGLIAVVDRMLAKDPTQRYGAPAEVAQALAPFAAGADLRRLSAAARQHGMPADAAPGKVASTEEFLSSPHTGTQSRTPPLDVQERALPALKAISPNTSTVAPSPLLARLGKTGYFRPALIATAAALLLLAAVVVYRIQTDQGTFVVKIEGDGAQAILEKDGLIIRDKNSDRTWTLKAAETKPLPSGEYKLEGAKNLQLLVTDDSGAELKTDAFTLKRKGAVHVLVTLERDAPVVAKASPQPTTSDPERAAAEWVLGKGGKVSFYLARKRAEGVLSAIDKVADLPAEPFAISTIVLSGCQFESQEELARLAALPVADRYQLMLYLSSTNLENAGLENVVKCRQITHLMLDGTKVTDEGLRVIGQIPGLADLYLPKQISDAGMKHVASCPTLAVLDLGYSKVTDSGIAELKSLTKLIGINVRSTDVSLTGLATALKDCDLESLSVDVDRQADLARLSQWPKLHWFQSSNGEVGDEGLAHLANQPELQTLYLIGSRVTDAGCAPLKRLKKLQDLAISHAPIGDGAMPTLGDMPQLRRLAVHGTSVTDAGIKELEKLQDLESLNLLNTKVSEAGIKSLQAALPKCKIEWDGKKDK
ncbi:MAG: protein kinase domain-containing protein [Pirellulaceae bacterium]